MITKDHDDWMQEIWESHTVMIVTLSDGTTVYQDEGRYPDPFIERLKKYCEEEKVGISKIVLRFRTHYELAYDGGDHDGIFLRKSILGAIFNDRNQNYYIIGYVKDNKIYCSKWEVPEVILVSGFDSDVRELDGHEQSIIWNTKIS